MKCLSFYYIINVLNKERCIILMGETNNFSTRLAHYLRARFSFLSITTWEEGRLIRDIKKICSDEEQIKTIRNVYTWSLTEGLVSDSDSSLRKFKQPMQALDQIIKIEEPAVFILKDFHIYLGGSGRQADHSVVRRIRDLVSMIENDPNPKNVIFVSPTFDIPIELQKDIMVVEYGLPTHEELEKILDQMIEL